MEVTLFFSLSQRLKYERDSQDKLRTRIMSSLSNLMMVQIALLIISLFVLPLVESIGNTVWNGICKLTSWPTWCLYQIYNFIAPITNEGSLWDFPDPTATPTGRTSLAEDNVSETNSRVRSNTHSQNSTASPVSRRGQIVWYYLSPRDDVPEGYIRFETGFPERAFFSARNVVFGHGSKGNWPWFESGDWVDCYVKDNAAFDVKYFSSPPHFARRLQRLDGRSACGSIYLDLPFEHDAADVDEDINTRRFLHQHGEVATEKKKEDKVLFLIRKTRHNE